MKIEFLTELGLEKEVIDKIMAENGKSINDQKAITAAKEAELATATQTIETLQETVKKVDGVDVDQLKADLASLQGKYDTDLAAARLNNAVDTALLAAKSKNTKAVRALLDMEQIKLDGDKLLGLDSQLEKLKGDAAYLFDEGTPPKPGARVDSGAPHQDPPATGPQNLREAIAEKMNTKGE